MMENTKVPNERIEKPKNIRHLPTGIMVLGILLLLVGAGLTFTYSVSFITLLRLKSSASMYAALILPISIGILLIIGSILLFSFPDKQGDLEKNTISVIGSVIFLIVNVLLLLMFSKIVKGFEGVLLDLQSLSIITRIALKSPYLFIMIAVALVAKEFLKNKQKTVVINCVTILILLFAVFPFLIVGLYLPMYQMAEVLESVDKTEKKGYIKYYDIKGNKISKESLKSGEKDGTMIQYYGSGKMLLEKPFKNGKVDGIIRTYYANGTIFSEITYKNGKKEGVFRQYDKNGNLMQEKIYHDGRIIETEK